MNEEKEKKVQKNYIVHERREFLLNSLYRIGSSLKIFLQIIILIFTTLFTFSLYRSLASKESSDSSELSSSKSKSRLETNFVKNNDVEPESDWVNDCSYSEKISSEIRLYFDNKEQNKIQPFLKSKFPSADGKISVNSWNRNFIFHGKPGTGKSRCALLIAKNISSCYTVVPGGSLQEIYVGSGARVWKRIISDAKKKAKGTKKPVVIIVDEMDSLANSKDNFNSRDDTLVNTFLESIDSIKRDNSNVIIFGTTNVINSMESAAIRVGRFNKIYFEYPDEIGLDKIIKEVKKEVENNYNISENRKYISSLGIDNKGKIFIDPGYWDSLKKEILMGLSNQGKSDVNNYPVTFAQISSSVEKLIIEKISKFRSDYKKDILIIEKTSSYETSNRVLEMSKEEQQKTLLSGLFGKK